MRGHSHGDVAIALNGLHGVEKEIENDLVNLIAIVLDLGEIGVGHNFNANGFRDHLLTGKHYATTTSAWVLVDSVMSDSNGIFLLDSILAAGTGTTANAYSLVVNMPGYAAFTSGNLTVAADQVVISNIALTVTALLPSLLGKNASLAFFHCGRSPDAGLGTVQSRPNSPDIRHERFVAKSGFRAGWRIANQRACGFCAFKRVSVSGKISCWMACRRAVGISNRLFLFQRAYNVGLKWCFFAHGWEAGKLFPSKFQISQLF